MDWPANGPTPVTFSLVSVETGWSRRTRPEVSVSQTWSETGVGVESDVGTDPQARLISRPTASGVRVARYISIASPGGTTPTTWVSLMSGRLCTPGGRSRATSGDGSPGDTETVTATGTGVAEDVPPGGDATGTAGRGRPTLGHRNGHRDRHRVAGDVPLEGDATDTSVAKDIPLEGERPAPARPRTSHWGHRNGHRDRHRRGRGRPTRGRRDRHRRTTPGDVPLWDTETVTATGIDVAEDVPLEDDATGIDAPGDVPPEGDRPAPAGGRPIGTPKRSPRPAPARPRLSLAPSSTPKPSRAARERSRRAPEWSGEGEVRGPPAGATTGAPPPDRGFRSGAIARAGFACLAWPSLSRVPGPWFAPPKSRHRSGRGCAGHPTPRPDHRPSDATSPVKPLCSPDLSSNSGVLIGHLSPDPIPRSVSGDRIVRNGTLPQNGKNPPSEVRMINNGEGPCQDLYHVSENSDLSAFPSCL